MVEISSGRSLAPKCPNSLWNEFDDDLRAYFACYIAQGTGIALYNLPALSDDELWQAFKLICKRIIFDVPEPIRARLSLGNQWAIATGLACDCPYLPEGYCLHEIFQDARPYLEKLIKQVDPAKLEEALAQVAAARVSNADMTLELL